MSESEERALPGGNVNTVVRVAHTVRRSTGPWTPAVHALLHYLTTVGFDASPRVLGFDEQGREILTYIEGQPASRPWPPALRSDEGLRRLAMLIRRFHDAVRSFTPPSNAHWRRGDGPLAEGEIICHGDLGPWNTIWQDDSVVGLIDWDSAYPGPVWDDVAYAAWFAVPLRDDAACYDAGFNEIPDRRHRLHVFSETYGLPPDVDLFAQVLRVQREDYERMVRLGQRGKEPWASFLRRGLAEEARREARWITEHHHLFTRADCGPPD